MVDTKFLFISTYREVSKGLLLGLLLIAVYLPSVHGSAAKVVYYYGPSFDDHQIYDLENVTEVLKHPKLIHNRTDLYMAGYQGYQENFSMHLVVESYLKGNFINMLSIDWAVLCPGTIKSALENLFEFAPQVADAILELFAAGLDRESFSLVGHSMGAIGVGLIGESVVTRSKGKVQLSRINALDPENYDIFNRPQVQQTDAEFVFVIHTDAGGYGSNVSMGHADFWPNGGSAVQPGCPSTEVNDRCSHYKGYAYWAQIVANVDQEQLWAYRAESYDEFLRIGAENLRDTAVIMGVDCPSSARGDYYLQLNTTYGQLPILGLGD